MALHKSRHRKVCFMIYPCYDRGMIIYINSELNVQQVFAK